MSLPIRCTPTSYTAERSRASTGAPGRCRWTDVTPTALTPWSKVSLMEASHFDTLVAYAAVNRFRLDDLRPHIYRTKDGGRTWTEVVEGMPSNEVVNAVREDPVRRGLLYAGTERSVYVSFDDGGHWQSLRLDLPASSVRDLVVRDTDLVVATHGRSFWILDDITPLRQVAAAAAAAAAGGPYLYRPAPAVRVRWNGNTDTPLPPDEPAGRNPPAGALEQQFALALRLVRAVVSDSTALQRVHSLQARLKRVRERAAPGRSATLDSLDARAAALESGAGRPAPRPGAGNRGEGNLTRLNADLIAAYNVVEGADAVPTAAERAVVGDLERSLERLLARLRELEVTIGEL